MFYDLNTNNKTMHLRVFHALYSGLNDSCTGHLVFKLSIKQILTTPKCQPVSMSENIIQAVNEIDTITNKIQFAHFDSDQHTVQQNHFVNTLKITIKNILSISKTLTMRVTVI